MKQGKASKNKALKHVLCCVIILVIFVVTITLTVDAKVIETDESVNVEDTVPLREQLGKKYRKLENYKKEEVEVLEFNKPRIIEKDINYYINLNINALTFYSKIFGYSLDYVKSDLIKRSEDLDIEPTNIGSIKDNGELVKYDNVDYGIIEYFYNLISTSNEKRLNYKKEYTGSSDYVEKLIMYYTNIYNVDTTLALSIGAAESGYYKVSYMLKRNNVYGGMSSHGLIRHENIELGVLKYIRLLKFNYINKGLNDVYSIGRVYCPTYDEYGNIVASSHWINLVNTAKNKYKNYTQNITIDDIVNY